MGTENYKMHKYNLISILMPAISLVIIISAFFFLKPETTGLVVFSPNETVKNVNADVILETKSGEVVPPDAVIQIWIDDNKAEMTIDDFIKKTGKKYEIQSGELAEFGFFGTGFTGDYTYRLSLADFNIDRKIGKGEHIFLTRIIYRNKILYEKENRIMISE